MDSVRTLMRTVDEMEVQGKLVRHNKTACAMVLQRTNALRRPLVALQRLLQHHDEAAVAFQELLNGLESVTRKAHTRIQHGIDRGGLRKAMNRNKEKAKFADVVDVLMKLSLELNVLLNTFLVRVRNESDTSARTAVALHGFNAVEDGDLTFSEGDTITIVETDGKCWWTGQTADGSRGKFPLNYVLVDDRVEGAGGLSESQAYNVGRGTLASWMRDSAVLSTDPKRLGADQSSAVDIGASGEQRGAPVPRRNSIRMTMAPSEDEYRPVGVE